MILRVQPPSCRRATVLPVIQPSIINSRSHERHGAGHRVHYTVPCHSLWNTPPPPPAPKGRGPAPPTPRR